MLSQIAMCIYTTPSLAAPKQAIKNLEALLKQKYMPPAARFMAQKHSDTVQLSQSLQAYLKQANDTAWGPFKRPLSMEACISLGDSETFLWIEILLPDDAETGIRLKAALDVPKDYKAKHQKKALINFCLGIIEAVEAEGFVLCLAGEERQSITAESMKKAYINWDYQMLGTISGISKRLLNDIQLKQTELFYAREGYIIFDLTS